MKRLICLLLASSLATPALAQSGAGSASGGPSANQSILMGCRYNSSPPTLTNGQQAAIQCSSNGSILINGFTFSTFSGAGSSLNVQDPNWVQALADLTSPIPAGTNAIGSILPATTGGLSAYSEIVPANVTSVAVKASAGQVYDIEVGSNSATPLSAPKWIVPASVTYSEPSGP